MDFIGAIQSGFKNYARFTGVASRSEYWYFFLFITLSGLVITVVDNLSPWPVIGIIFNIVTFLPSLAVLVRRLRDAGFSWVWVLGPMVFGLTFIASLVYLIFVLWQNSLFTLDGELPDSATLSAQISNFIENNPGLLIWSLVMILSAVLCFASWLVVQIIFPTSRSRRFEEGNRHVQPANPLV